MLDFKDYIRVSKTKEEGLDYPSPATLYKWHHLKQHPEIFRKLGGFLFVKKSALAALIEAGAK